MGFQLTHQQGAALKLNSATLNSAGANGSAQAFGFNFPSLSLSNVAADITDRALFGFKTRIAFVNAHCINEMRRSAPYDNAVRSADMVLPDGSGMAIACLLQSGKRCPNLNGTDLTPEIIREAEKKGLSIFFLGARPGIADTAAANLKLEFPKLKIAGTYDGYFRPEENNAVIDKINASQPDILFVAMGVPMQDLWLEENAEHLNAPVLLGVGGLFDFLSERIPRAPLALRKLGMEWSYRLYQEPKRMARRYILGNPIFLMLAVLDALKFRTAAVGRILDYVARRFLDIVGATVGIVLLSPIFLATMIAIKLESKGAAFFKQERVGKNGVSFTMYKFRSMVSDAEKLRDALSNKNQHGENAVTFKLNDDPRVTPVGRFIRKYSIDELPQLINVLTGKMSLVGPRPALPSEVENYSADERKRLDVLPGITCLWQIKGRAGIDFKGQVALDIEYIKKRNIFQNIWILLQTPRAILSADGAY